MQKWAAVGSYRAYIIFVTTKILLFSGPRVFTGFFNRQETPDPTTAQAFTLDGWYRTDDFGWFNADGTLYALGRAKDVISRDGIHLYPGWLEAKIIQHQDVLEAVILPVGQYRMGFY